MLTLITFPAGFGQFSLSPFCNKAAMLLQSSGRQWRRRDTSDPRKMPNGKLPVLDTGAGLVADSGGIRDWLERQGADFDSGLTAAQKARALTLTRMAEEHLYFHLVMDRWDNDAVWPTIRDTYFPAIPRLIRSPVTNRIRARVRAGLHTQGIARFPASERMARLEADLRAIAALLADTPFLFGARPVSADFSVASMLSGLRATPVATEITARLAGDAVLVAYLDRMNQAIPLP